MLIRTLLLTATLAMTGCGYYKPQSIAGIIASHKAPLNETMVGFASEGRSCAEAELKARLGSNGHFRFNRSLRESRIHNYVRDERLCINSGDGWVEIWTHIYAPAPKRLDFQCSPTQNQAEWSCKVVMDNDT